MRLEKGSSRLKLLRFACRRAANDLMEDCLCEVSGSSEATAAKSVQPRFHEANLRPSHCPGGQQEVVKYAIVSPAKPDRDDMALQAIQRDD